MLQCDLEGSMPNVTISLSLPTNGSPLQDILVHPCVTSLDSAILTSSSIDAADDSAFSGPYKFPLTPPLDSFNLCYYTSQVNNLGEVGTLLIFIFMNSVVSKSSILLVQTRTFHELFTRRFRLFCSNQLLMTH